MGSDKFVDLPCVKAGLDPNGGVLNGLYICPHYGGIDCYRNTRRECKVTCSEIIKRKLRRAKYGKC